MFINCGAKMESSVRSELGPLDEAKRGNFDCVHSHRTPGRHWVVRSRREKGRRRELWQVIAGKRVLVLLQQLAWFGWFGLALAWSVNCLVWLAAVSGAQEGLVERG